MSNKISRPITDLRDTNNISKECHNQNEPIFITKNGYDDLVIMSSDTYNKLNEFEENEEFPIQSNCYSMIRVGCATNNIKVAAPTYNAKEIIKIIEECKNKDLDILLFPELSITGYTCNDLFFQSTLLNSTLLAIEQIRIASFRNHTLIFVGAPLVMQDKLYNCAIAMCDGQILGVVPKSNIPNYNEFYESRVFEAYTENNTKILINGKEYPFGTKLIFIDKYQTKLKVACEICEDLWAVNTPSTMHALNGANVIVNLSASNELYGKDLSRKNLVASASSRLVCAYLYASSGNGESTSELVFSSHNIIAENGLILSESELFKNQLIINEIDLDRLEANRRKVTSFKSKFDKEYEHIYFSKKLQIKSLTRRISQTPFLPNDPSDFVKYTTEIIRLQKMALAHRMNYLNNDKVVIELSYSLDSILALIVCYETFKYLGYDYSNINCIVMSSEDSFNDYNDFIELAKLFNVTIKKVDVKPSTSCYDSLFSINSSSLLGKSTDREKAHILFDYANFIGGLVVGSLNLSKIALGFCTYNGDQMSSYDVNSSVSETLVRFLLENYSKINTNCENVLNKILSKNHFNKPYELYDFFVYYFLKYNYSFDKIAYFANQSFKEKISKEQIRKELDYFMKRFFASQYKRSSMPDGPKVTEISLSSKGDLRVPSDLSNINLK